MKSRILLDTNNEPDKTKLSYPSSNELRVESTVVFSHPVLVSWAEPCWAEYAPLAKGHTVSFMDWTWFNWGSANQKYQLEILQNFITE